MKKIVMEKFSLFMLTRQSLASIKGGYGGQVQCSCSYFGGAFTESGVCAGGSTETCASAGASKYGAGNGSCICVS